MYTVMSNNSVSPELDEEPVIVRLNCLAFFSIILEEESRQFGCFVVYTRKKESNIPKSEQSRANCTILYLSSNPTSFRLHVYAHS